MTRAEQGKEGCGEDRAAHAHLGFLLEDLTLSKLLFLLSMSCCQAPEVSKSDPPGAVLPLADGFVAMSGSYFWICACGFVSKELTTFPFPPRTARHCARVKTAFSCCCWGKNGSSQGSLLSLSTGFWEAGVQTLGEPAAFWQGVTELAELSQLLPLELRLSTAHTPHSLHTLPLKLWAPCGLKVEYWFPWAGICLQKHGKCPRFIKMKLVFLLVWDMFIFSSV